MADLSKALFAKDGNHVLPSPLFQISCELFHTLVCRVNIFGRLFLNFEQWYVKIKLGILSNILLEANSCPLCP